MSLAANDETSSLLDGIGDESLEAVEESVRHHRSNVGSLQVGLVLAAPVAQDVVEAEGLDAAGHLRHEGGVDGGGDDKSFDPDAVLARSLERSSHPGVVEVFEVGGGENDAGILLRRVSRLEG